MIEALEPMNDVEEQVVRDALRQYWLKDVPLNMLVLGLIIVIGYYGFNSHPGLRGWLLIGGIMVLLAILASFYGLSGQAGRYALDVYRRSLHSPISAEDLEDLRQEAREFLFDESRLDGKMLRHAIIDGDVCDLDALSEEQAELIIDFDEMIYPLSAALKDQPERSTRWFTASEAIDREVMTLVDELRRAPADTREAADERFDQALREITE